MSGGGEGADAEDRTEAPTPKRVERARSEGQAPLSRDAVGLHATSTSASSASSHIQRPMPIRFTMASLPRSEE